MERADFDEFISIIDMMFENFKRPSLSNNTSEMWFDALRGYPLQEIKKACLKICTDRKWGSFCPTLGEFLEFLDTPIQKEKRLSIKRKVIMLLDLIIKKGGSSILEIENDTHKKYLQAINFVITGGNRKKMFHEPGYVERQLDEIVEAFIQISLGRLKVPNESSIWLPVFNRICDETEIIKIGVHQEVRVIEVKTKMITAKQDNHSLSMINMRDMLTEHIKKYGKIGLITANNVDKLFEKKKKNENQEVVKSPDSCRKISDLIGSIDDIEDFLMSSKKPQHQMYGVE